MVFIFESHPVQYRAPVYQALQRRVPDRFRVIYASDCSVRGHQDREFGQVIAWNTPLLEGYPFTILHNENGTPLQGFFSLTGRGVKTLLRRERPDAVLFCQFLYAFDAAAYLACLRLGIPIWMRQETQDEAGVRSALKTWLRSWVYALLYAPVRRAFYIGALNRAHLLRHGISEDRLVRSPYCVPPPPPLNSVEKTQRRAALRARLGVPDEATLVLFSGKWIPKKNPGLLLDALLTLPALTRTHFHILYIGGGALEPELRAQAATLPGQVHFGGLVNQGEIFDYYLAADLLMLPSRRAGETWGLVVNEALQAGCGVVVTEAVGSHAEFGGWERVRVIPTDDASAAGQALTELALFPRDFDWCVEALTRYSVECAAEGLAREIETLPPPS